MNKIKIEYKKTSKTFHGVRYIRENSNSTFIDFITKEGIIKVELDNINKINNILQCFRNIEKLVCLDFHGVADLYNGNEKIPTLLPKCIISYIGGKPETIKNTIDEIKPRVLSNEIIMGIIVYNKDNNPTCGTKGWIIKTIKAINNNMTIHFIDDSMKNINCVNNVSDKDIHTYFIDKFINKQNNMIPKEQLSYILNKI